MNSDFHINRRVGSRGIGRVMLLLLFAWFGFGSSVAVIAAEPATSTPKSLESDVQSLRRDVLELNKDLAALEEELLFPANTQVAVFLSLDVGAFFELDSVQVRLDNKEVTNYLYTEREKIGRAHV